MHYFFVFLVGFNCGSKLQHVRFLFSMQNKNKLSDCDSFNLYIQLLCLSAMAICSQVGKLKITTMEI